jgi:hypothetical protein
MTLVGIFGLDQALLREEWLHLFDVVLAMEYGRTE